MHVHVSALEFLTTACYIVIFGFLWRAAAAAKSDTPLGKAMSTIF